MLPEGSRQGGRPENRWTSSLALRVSRSKIPVVLVRQVQQPPLGHAVPVTVLREGKSKTLKVKLGRPRRCGSGQANRVAQRDEAQPEAPAVKSVWPDRHAADDDIAPPTSGP